MNAEELQEWFDTVPFEYACAIVHSSDFHGTQVFPFDGDTQEEAHLKAANYIIERLNGGSDSKMSDQDKITFLNKTMRVLPGWTLTDISNELEDKGTGNE